MPDPEIVHVYNCPYCGASISLKIDLPAGERRSFTAGCKDCRRSMEIEIESDPDGDVHLIAKRQGEG